MMCGFEENVRKPDFLAKNGQKWQKLAIFGQNLETRIFSKIRLEHFFSLAKMQLCAKLQKNPMRGSPDVVWRTHRRTHAWVWVHSSHRLRRRDKKLPNYFYFLLNTWMLVESYPVMANSTPVLSRRCCRWRRRNRARSRVPVGVWGARHKCNCSQMLTGSAPSLRSRLEPKGKGGGAIQCLAWTYENKHKKHRAYRV